MAKKKKNNDFLIDAEGDDIPMMAEFETVSAEDAPKDLSKEFPVMPLRNLMIFPSIVMPISVGP